LRENLYVCNPETPTLVMPEIYASKLTRLRPNKKDGDNVLETEHKVKV
jgi:hypothetical protein